MARKKSAVVVTTITKIKKLAVAGAKKNHTVADINTCDESDLKRVEPVA